MPRISSRIKNIASRCGRSRIFSRWSKAGIRIPYSEIYFLLKRVDADTIEIEYGLDVDPGGALPNWVVRRTARNTLIDTIIVLEAQVAWTRDQYQFEIKALAEELQ